MSLEELVGALWRRRLIVILTVITITAATYVVAQGLPPVYTSDVTLVVKNDTDAANDFEAIQSSQVLTKTYAELIEKEPLPSSVAEEFSVLDSGDEVLERVSFEPIPETQLITITAEGDSPEEAALLANRYAVTATETFRSGALEAALDGKIRIINRAIATGAPVRPRPTLYALVAFVVALFLGGALAVLRDRLEAGLGSDEEIIEDLDLPILARVPTVGRRRITLSEPMDDAEFIEALRVLWTNLRFAAASGAPRTVLITSPGAGEGKSLICVGLVRSVSEQGSEATLVEADLRRPSISAAFDAERGLSTALRDSGPLEAEIQERMELGGSRLLPAGPAAPNAPTLLSPETLRQIEDESRHWGDVIVFDSPPIAVGPDARLLARMADVTVLVISRKQTKRRRAIAAVRELRQTGATLAGVVVNDAPRQSKAESAYYSAPLHREVVGKPTPPLESGGPSWGPS